MKVLVIVMVKSKKNIRDKIENFIEILTELYANYNELKKFIQFSNEKV